MKYVLAIYYSEPENVHFSSFAMNRGVTFLPCCYSPLSVPVNNNKSLKNEYNFFFSSSQYTWVYFFSAGTDGISIVDNKDKKTSICSSAGSPCTGFVELNFRVQVRRLYLIVSRLRLMNRWDT